MDDFLTPEERAAMIDADGYLSRNRPYLARQQRERRAGMARIDYMPSADAVAILQARKAQEWPNSVGSTNSAVLDAILCEWAELVAFVASENAHRRHLTESQLAYAVAAMKPFEERKARERMAAGGAIGGASKGDAGRRHPIQDSGRTANKLAEKAGVGAPTGTNYGEVRNAKSPGFAHQYAQARMTAGVERSGIGQECDDLPGISARIAHAHPRAYDSKPFKGTGFVPVPAHPRAYDSKRDTRSNCKIAVSRGRAYDSKRRVICGAKRHRDGQPCQAKSEPGKKRCRFHGGRSTGPKTPEGKARALANLRQNRVPGA